MVDKTTIFLYAKIRIIFNTKTLYRTLRSIISAKTDTEIFGELNRARGTTIFTEYTYCALLKENILISVQLAKYVTYKIVFAKK